MVFTATCRGCYLLSLLMQELKISSAALHSHLTQNRRAGRPREVRCSCIQCPSLAVICQLMWSVCVPIRPCGCLAMGMSLKHWQ